MENQKFRMACKIKKALKCVILILSMFSLTVLVACKLNETIIIEKKGSFFSDFEIKENKVYIKCELVIKNTYSTDKKIKLNAQFAEDKENGLLTEKNLIGFSTDYQTNIFTIKNGENRIIVYFIGDWGGNAQKQNRNLPNINLSEID